MVELCRRQGQFEIFTSHANKRGQFQSPVQYQPYSPTVRMSIGKIVLARSSRSEERRLKIFIATPAACLLAPASTVFEGRASTRKATRKTPPHPRGGFLVQGSGAGLFCIGLGRAPFAPDDASQPDQASP
jgi:hypothetical protein